MITSTNTKVEFKKNAEEVVRKSVEGILHNRLASTSKGVDLFHKARSNDYYAELDDIFSGEYEHLMEFKKEKNYTLEVFFCMDLTNTLVEKWNFTIYRETESALVDKNSFLLKANEYLRNLSTLMSLLPANQFVSKDNTLMESKTYKLDYKVLTSEKLTEVDNRLLNTKTNMQSIYFCIDSSEVKVKVEYLSDISDLLRRNQVLEIDDYEGLRAKPGANRVSSRKVRFLSADLNPKKNLPSVENGCFFKDEKSLDNVKFVFDGHFSDNTKNLKDKKEMKEASKDYNTNSEYKHRISLDFSTNNTYEKVSLFKKEKRLTTNENSFCSKKSNERENLSKNNHSIGSKKSIFMNICGRSHSSEESYELEFEEAGSSTTSENISIDLEQENHENSNIISNFMNKLSILKVTLKKNSYKQNLRKMLVQRANYLSIKKNIQSK